MHRSPSPSPFRVALSLIVVTLICTSSLATYRVLSGRRLTAGTRAPSKPVDTTIPTLDSGQQRPEAAGQLTISEFRLRGPAGAQDEFIELYNDSASSLTVTSSDGSSGYSVAASDGVVRFVIPNG